MNFSARELRFSLHDKSRFDAEALKKALKAEGFPDVQVKAGPPGAPAPAP
jgi:phosphotransferase system IIB component